MAAENGHLDCVRALLEAQADVNIISDKGWWTVCWPCLRLRPMSTSSVIKVGGHLDCVQALLEAQADVNIISDKGWWTPGLCAGLA